MHQEIASYNDKGIEVRYLAYPRAGVGSESFNKAVSVWCSDDPKDAITKAKRGEEVPTKQCENPVKDQFELGQQMGVRGTPSLVLESGQMIPGYVPADRLVQMLDDMNKTN
jgi:thiol:disulfide interchange protein DsbC